jgi:hypothetical protein
MVTMANPIVLEKGNGWRIIFRYNPSQYIVLEYLCLGCGHRLSRLQQKGKITWKHFYSINYAEKPWPCNSCFCTCDMPQGPEQKEQQRSYKRLAYWKRQFQLHREKFFKGEINGRNQGRKI